ncbi:Ba35 [Baboon cytomegalovirus]|nr:Ba35 [Baboon cytomegalovirus]
MDQALYVHFFGRPQNESMMRHVPLRAEGDEEVEEDYPPIPQVPQTAPQRSCISNGWQTLRMYTRETYFKWISGGEDDRVSLTKLPNEQKKNGNKLSTIGPKLRRMLSNN